MGDHRSAHKRVVAYVLNCFDAFCNTPMLLQQKISLTDFVYKSCDGSKPTNEATRQRCFSFIFQRLSEEKSCWQNLRNACWIISSWISSLISWTRGMLLSSLMVVLQTFRALEHGLSGYCAWTFLMEHLLQGHQRYSGITRQYSRFSRQFWGEVCRWLDYHKNLWQERQPRHHQDWYPRDPDFHSLLGRNIPSRFRCLQGGILYYPASACKR